MISNFKQLKPKKCPPPSLPGHFLMLENPSAWSATIREFVNTASKFQKQPDKKKPANANQGGA